MMKRTDFDREFRLIWIDAYLEHNKMFNVADLMEAFGISKAVGVHLTVEYQRRFPNSMTRYWEGSLVSGFRRDTRNVPAYYRAARDAVWSAWDKTVALAELNQ
jgi:hypothetical protein